MLNIEWTGIDFIKISQINVYKIILSRDCVVKNKFGKNLTQTWTMV